MILLDYVEIKKGEKTHRIATFYDPKARRKVETKFLNAEVTVPKDKVISEKDIKTLQTVEVTTDLSGNVLTIK